MFQMLGRKIVCLFLLISQSIQKLHLLYQKLIVFERSSPLQLLTTVVTRSSFVILSSSSVMLFSANLAQVSTHLLVFFKVVAEIYTRDDT